MPLFIKIDFRKDGLLGAWYSRDTPHSGEWASGELITKIKGRDVCVVLRELANELSEKYKEPK